MKDECFDGPLYPEVNQEFLRRLPLVQSFSALRDGAFIVYLRDGRSFETTNRPFTHIDGFFDGLVSASLERRLATGNPVVVGDIGGGFKSQAAKDILARYSHPGLCVYNIDLLAADPQSSDSRLHVLRGEFRTLQIPGFDIIYSWQALISLRIPGEAEAGYKVLADHLNPGGEGFIDNPSHAWLLSRRPGEREKLRWELGLSELSTPMARNEGKDIWPYLHFVKAE